MENEIPQVPAWSQKGKAPHAFWVRSSVKSFPKKLTLPSTGGLGWRECGVHRRCPSLGGGPRAARILLAGAGGGAQPGPRGTFQEARGGSKKSAGDALVPRAAAAATGTAQVTASYLSGSLSPGSEN